MRSITAAEMDALSARNLTDRQFRRAVYALEHGATALKLLDLRTQRDVAARLYRDALDAAVMRSGDGSLQPYQLQTLTQAFANWRAAVEALADHQSSRPTQPAQAAE